MDTNKQLKLRRISTIFHSCRRNDTTTTNKTPSKPKPPTHPFPSIHKPNTPLTPKLTIRSRKPDPARQKLSESYNYSLFYSAHSAPLLEKQSLKKHTTRRQSTLKKQRPHKKQGKRDEKMWRKRIEIKKARSFITTSSEEEEDNEVGSSSRRRLFKKRNADDDDHETQQRRSDCCYAIVKCSEDPYMDFRTSMVEMIVEKRMRKAEDLERLLQCFLKINSYRHHEVIIEAFMEIWDALFLYSTASTI